MMSGQQLTVRTLAALLADVVASNPGAADFVIEADGCDCVGAAFGVRVNETRGEVLIAREGWNR